MDPYQPPAATLGPVPGKAPAEAPRGLPCAECGSLNTSAGDIFRSRPNFPAVYFFGPFTFLVRSAFRVSREYCHDCGGIRRYRTTGSKLSAVILAVIVIVALISFLGR